MRTLQNLTVRAMSTLFLTSYFLVNIWQYFAKYCMAKVSQRYSFMYLIVFLYIIRSVNAAIVDMILIKHILHNLWSIIIDHKCQGNTAKIQHFFLLLILNICWQRTNCNDHKIFRNIYFLNFLTTKNFVGIGIFCTE